MKEVNDRSTDRGETKWGNGRISYVRRPSRSLSFLSHPPIVGRRERVKHERETDRVTRTEDERPVSSLSLTSVGSVPGDRSEPEETT